MNRADPALSAAARSLLRSWRIRVWAVLAAALGIGLTRLPLFDVLGYEHALAAAVFASLAGLDLGAALARHAAAHVDPTRAVPPLRLVAGLAWRAVAIAAAVTAIPGAIAAVHGIWATTCDWGFGVRAYLSLTTATAALAAAAGLVVGLAVGPRPAVGTVAWALLWLAVAAAGLWRFYSAPPVFSYDPIVGYFPGNLYDAGVSLGAALYWARLEQVLVVVAALAAVALLLDAPTLRLRLRERRPARLQRAPAVIAAVAVLAAAVMHVESGRLGYAVDAGDIDDALGGRIVTPHFVIHYAHRPDLDADIQLIAADHEFRYAQVARALGTEVRGRIDSYYFADADQKARWMGARYVEMAKPWRREIYVDHRAFPHPQLRHEIAHVVAGQFGDPLFGVAARRVLGVPLLFDPGLIEGLAVAADWPNGYRLALTPHQAVRALIAQHREPSIDAVFSLGFLSLASARSYTVAGSFVRFLLDRYGAPAMQRLYRSGGDFEAAYGVPMANLVAAWRTMIDAIQLPPGAVQEVSEVFRHGGAFAVRCRHAIAAWQREAADKLGAGDREGAVRLYRKVCTDDPGEPDHLLTLAAVLAAGGDAERAEADSITTGLAFDALGATTTVRARALAQLAGRAAAAGHWRWARALVAAGVGLPSAPDQRRLLEAMSQALHHTGPAAPALVGYFFGGGDGLAWATLATQLEPGLGLGWYLRGLQDVVHGDHAAASRDLGLGLILGLPGERFRVRAARQLAISAFRTGDDDAVRHAAAVLDGGSQVDHLLADDWRERLVWRRTGALPAAR